MTPVSTDESKDTFKKYEELLGKIKYLFKSKSDNTNIYGEKYMKNQV